MGHRMSSLPIAKLCAMAPTLNVGAGRAAAKSSAFHARCATQGGRLDRQGHALMQALTEEERADIDSWHMPEPLEIFGLTLNYSDAATEVEVGLAEDETTTTDPAEVMTLGHVDFYWDVRIDVGGQPCKVVVVADIKKQRWTCPEGPNNSLQLKAYGHALGTALSADYYLPALWLAEEGAWVVGELQGMFGLEATTRWSEIKAAATHISREFSHGSHCGECWSRLNCPAHMVRYDDVLTVPGTLETELTPESALELLTEYKRFEDTAAAAKDYLKAWVVRNGPVRDGKGKQWGPINVKGRESVIGVAKLREALGPDAEKYISRGAESTQTRWHKEK